MARESIPWERINDYVLACGEVHDPYRFCVTALERMRDLVKFDQGVFFVLDGNRRIVRRHFLDFPERWSSIYLEYYSRTSNNDFSLNRDLSETPGSPYVAQIDWEGIRADSNDDFMQYYIRARGLRYTLSFVLFDLNGEPSAPFSLDRVSGSRFSRREIECVRIAASHLNNLYKNMLVRSEGQTRIWEATWGSEALTPREREVVDLMCQGITPANNSRELRISLGTTNKHIAHIYKKMGVGSRQELLVRLLGTN